MSLEFVDAALLKRLFVAATNHLEQNKATVDALNVFPVPDGDTGTNMTMTMLAASREVQKAPETSVAEVAEACAMGSLMGARGNSGVILSQLFRGFAKGLEGKRHANASDIAGALQEGVRTAYKAVMKPVEGTILTVARESAKAALSAARQNEDVLGVIEAAHREAEATLARTPDLLPILKKAGVVDSGGKGFTYVLEGYLEALRGAALAAHAGVGAVTAAGKDTSPAGAVQFSLLEEYDIRFPYDIELMIRGTGLLLDDIRQHLSPLGDSILVVGTAELAKVHIHAANPGPVLDICVGAGTVFNIEILNMQVQHEDIRLRAGESAEAPAGSGRLDPKEGLLDASLDGLVQAQPVEPEETGVDIAVVAVAAGDGLAEIFRSLGVARVIEGGQTMNPSTEDLLRAARETGARKVILLPNNKNIILAAQQVAQLAGDQEIHVIPTKSFPQGIAAMLAWEPDGDVTRITADMGRLSKAVKTGEVTYSVRDTAIGDLRIKKGDILGLADGQIVTTGSAIERVTIDVVAGLMRAGGEIITLYYGEGTTAEAAAALADELRKQHGAAEVEVHYGGQPLYYYLISVE
ncbi:MAG: DAK2 domain-containing protein [Symbiobacteriia bacterium]